MSTTKRSSSNAAACHASSPSGDTTIDPPSNTNSSCPPTAFTYTIHAPVSRARSLHTWNRSAVLWRWYGEALMLGMTLVRSRAYSVHGRPAVHASSHTDSPSAEEASRTGHDVAPGTKYRCSSKTP